MTEKEQLTNLKERVTVLEMEKAPEKYIENLRNKIKELQQSIEAK